MRSTEQQLWPVLYIAPSASDSAAAFGVGIVGDVGRVLAAELELQPHHARADRRGDARAGRDRAGEEDAVDRLREQRRADVAGADDASMNTSSGTPASCSSRAMCRPVSVANSDGL